MQRGSHAGFCTFDERSAGGRYQTHAELRHFKHVLGDTKSMVDRGEKGAICLLRARCFGISDWKSTRLSDERHGVGVAAVRRRAAVWKPATERDAHEHRIANMNRRITDYHNKVRIGAAMLLISLVLQRPSPTFCPSHLFSGRRSAPCEHRGDEFCRYAPKHTKDFAGHCDSHSIYLDTNARDAYCDALLEYIRQQKEDAQTAAGYGISARSGPEDSAEDEDTPAATSPRPLPLGWEEKTDAKGCVFFIDHIHRLTTWTDPRMAVAAQETSPRTTSPTSPRSSPSSSPSLSRYGGHVLS
ncbi:Ww domain-containing oxidoreductase, partial [Globisporangium splendens]